MAFIVQGVGSATPNANAYITVAEFKAYHDDRGGSYSAFTDPQIEKAIVRATDYIDQNWNFLGLRTFSPDQELEWPRSGVYTRPELDLIDDQATPKAVKYACAEIALAALSFDLDPNSPPNPGQLVTSQRAGDLAVSFAPELAQKGSPTWARAEKLLGPLTCGPELMRA